MVPDVQYDVIAITRVAAATTIALSVTAPPDRKGAGGRSDMSSDRARSPVDVTTTVELLARARGGDDEALDALFRRCIPALSRWARGRLPSYARDLLDTQDLVQETVVHMLRHIDSFEYRHEGAVHAYLRQAVLNRIRDEIRRRARRPADVELSDRYAATDASPLEAAIGQQGIERYERALARLRPEDREAIVGRMELQYSYKELAVILGKPTPDAARVAVARAVARLATEMDHDARS